MKFVFKEREIQYLQKEFNIPSLVGIDKRIFPIFGVKKSLIERCIIVECDGIEQLSNDYKILFNIWKNMRYHAARINLPSNMPIKFVLFNTTHIIVLAEPRGMIEIELIPYSKDALCDIMANLMEFDINHVYAEDNFVVDISGDVLEEAMSKKGIHKNDLANRFGVDAELLSYAIHEIGDKPDSAYSWLLSEDKYMSVGALTKLFMTPRGICALKHVTPENTSDKFVLMFGDTKTIIDNFFVF